MTLENLAKIKTQISLPKQSDVSLSFLALLPIVGALIAQSLLANAGQVSFHASTDPLSFGLFQRSNYDYIEDSIRVVTAIAAVIGFAGCSCMALVQKKKGQFDTRIVKALLMFPGLPFLIYLLASIFLADGFATVSKAL